MGDAAAVLTEARGAVLVITLNRPDARNAVNGAMAQALAGALERLDADDALSVGVITGAGRGFCSGMDLKAFVAGEATVIEGRGFAGIAERPPDKPLIAAVEGFAVAGGLEIALACDLIVAARDARVGIPEVTRGLIAAAGGLLRLPRRVPHQLAMRLALTGELVAVEDVASSGLVAEVVGPGEALDAALRLADVLAANAPLAVQASKQIIAEQWAWTPQDAWRHQTALAKTALESEDAREGARAFAEKRAPQWQGA
jgi:enoyl-CoA hydratase